MERVIGFVIRVGNEPAQKIVVCANVYINVHVGVAKILIYWIETLTTLQYGDSEDPGKSAHLRRLAWDFTARQNAKVQNLVWWTV